MANITNTDIPMILDRLYGSECSTQASYASSAQPIQLHQKWLDSLLDADSEADITSLLNPSGNEQHSQHSIDTYLAQVYIHEHILPPYSPLYPLVGSPLTLTYDTPSGTTYRHLLITAISQLDHEGSYGYYRIIAQPVISRLHQHPHCRIDTETDVVSMTAERLTKLDIEVIDDSAQDWTPARMTQWQLSDWAHICERLSRQGLTAFLHHNQTAEYHPPKLVITTKYPTEADDISQNVGIIRYHQVLHDRLDAPFIAFNQKIVTIPNQVNINRFDSLQVSHPNQSSQSTPIYNSDVFEAKLSLDTPAALAPVTDTKSIDNATILADHATCNHCQYRALSYATDAKVADTFELMGHDSLDHHYRLIHVVHLLRNNLSHITGLTVSKRHKQRHASHLNPGTHLTQLTLITADTPWVGAFYSRRSLPPMTGITEPQSDGDSRDHMTPTRLALFDTPAQSIHRMEAQAGANYGSHFTHRAGDQTLVQSIGDGEHLINAGSLLSTTRPSLFKAVDDKAVESGYRHKAGGSLSEWVTDHRSEKAYSQLNISQGGVTATLKMGVVNPSGSDSTPKREGIHATTNAQVSVKTGQAMVISSQPQTHAQSHTQSEQHDYQHHTPTLNQTSLGGQHLAERLSQLASGLGRNVSSHNDIKTQLEAITKEQTSTTHHKTPYTLIDGASDCSYVSEELLVHRSMGEMLSTTQQDRTVSSGDTHHQVSGESTTIVADGSFSMTNSKQDIRLSAHTGKLEATAKQDVNIASSTKEVEIVATNKITLRAGGATITLEGGDITVAATQFTEKSGKHSTAGGGFDGQGLGGLPEFIAGAIYKAQFKFADDDDIAYANTPYVAINERTQETYDGITDDEGKTETFFSAKPDEIKVHLKLSNYSVQFSFADDDDIPYSFIDYIAQAILTGEVFEGTTDAQGYTDYMYTSVKQEIKVHLKV